MLLDVRLYYVYRTDEGMRETELKYLVDFGLIIETMEAIEKFALQRGENISRGNQTKYTLSCIKIHSLTVSRLGEDRLGLGTLFEWKCDWPGKLEQYVESTIERVKSHMTQDREKA
jgi:hypothetical protein